MSKRKGILFAVLGILTAIGVFALVSNLIGTRDEDLTEINPTYSIGTLDSNGKYQEGTSSLYTSNAIKLEKGDELKFELDFENNITYQLFYYDESDIFTNSSETLNNNFTLANENKDVYVRILITPQFGKDEDKVIHFYDKGDYSSQLSIFYKNVPQELVLHWDKSGNAIALDVRFEENMTWGEWLESDYNIYGATIEDGYLVVNDIQYYAETLVRMVGDEPIYENMPILENNLMSSYLECRFGTV